jgi:dolichol kinase
MNHLEPPDKRPHRPPGHETHSSHDSTVTRTRPALERSPHPYHRRSYSVKQDDRSRLSPPSSQSVSRSESTESGTEADDEKGLLLKSLPAPPIRYHKGLKGTSPIGLSPAQTPLPTPQAAKESFLDANAQREQSEERRKRDAYYDRKKAEIVRRITETVLLLAIVALNWHAAGGVAKLKPWRGELCISTIVPLVLYGLYPLRRSCAQILVGRTIATSFVSGFYVPSRFDPGPLLYPVGLPTAIALALYGFEPAYLPLALTCGLASIPDVLLRSLVGESLSYYAHWLISVAPLSQFLQGIVLGAGNAFVAIKSRGAITSDDLALVYPLHRDLCSTLKYLTTTSLDPTELELLSSGLIHLYFFARAPQSQILKALLWLGGITVFTSCRHLMLWEVELARIPRWRFAKVPHKSALSHRLQRAFSAFMSEPAPTSESSDDEIDTRAKPVPKSLQRVRTMALPEPPKRSNTTRITMNGIIKAPFRRNTISDLDPTTKKAVQRRSRSRPFQSSPFLSLTLQQARIRRYLYAAAVYMLVLLTILVPIRHYVGVYALHGHEPFGWAAGYLFGDIPAFRQWASLWGLTDWIALPEAQSAHTTTVSSSRDLRNLLMQPANARLVLAAYCMTVIAMGIIAVQQLTAYVEVDTRRKVFHGVMVAMLLPTIYIDPCFFALALALILAIFLLLDLFRASQLPPISRPLTTFLAPYVDGRDHRGPVIVSHIFLLIGCAIPLWLSLAGTSRTGNEPWAGWEPKSRDISMVAGVVCVGLGDAAASLVGRRYGRTKWYWGGGKSLEGSIAFAVAVTAGLMFAWTWLRLGQWATWDVAAGTVAWALVKCAIAACGASLLESVLTAANDNVVVPIGLWLLVKGLKI